MNAMESGFMDEAEALGITVKMVGPTDGVVEKKVAELEIILIAGEVYKLTLEEIKQLLNSGTSYAEFVACAVFPPFSWNDIPIVEWMRTLGPERCVISSDTRSPMFPICPEALRAFAQVLFENEITEEELTIMMNTNPSKLLGID